jgi:hypothetical protein
MKADRQARIAALTDALRAAKEAADQSERENSDDGGSCNMDTCVFYPTKGTRRTTVESASAAAGVSVDIKDHGGWWVWLGGGGQASLRTRRMEAAAKAIQAEGFDAYVWYQLD